MILRHSLPSPLGCTIAHKSSLHMQYHPFSGAAMSSQVLVRGSHGLFSQPLISASTFRTLLDMEKQIPMHVTLSVVCHSPVAVQSRSNVESDLEPVVWCPLWHCTGHLPPKLIEEHGCVSEIGNSLSWSKSGSPQLTAKAVGLSLPQAQTAYVCRYDGRGSATCCPPHISK